MNELRSRSDWGIQPDRSNKYRRQIGRVHDEKVHIICKRNKFLEISFQNDVPYSNGHPSNPSEDYSFQNIVKLNKNRKIPHVGIVFIPEMFDTDSTLEALLKDIQR